MPVQSGKRSAESLRTVRTEVVVIRVLGRSLIGVAETCRNSFLNGTHFGCRRSLARFLAFPTDTPDYPNVLNSELVKPQNYNEHLDLASQRVPMLAKVRVQRLDRFPTSKWLRRGDIESSDSFRGLLGDLQNGFRGRVQSIRSPSKGVFEPV